MADKFGWEKSKQKDAAARGSYEKHQRPDPDMKLSFGKHQGTKIKDVPTDYLQWMVEKADKLSTNVRIAAEEEYMRRIKPPIKPTNTPSKEKKVRPGRMIMPIGTYTGRQIREVPKEYLWQCLWDEELGDAMGPEVLEAIIKVVGRGREWAEKNGYITPEIDAKESEEDQNESSYQDGPPLGWVPWYRPDCRYNEEQGQWELAIHPDISAQLLAKTASQEVPFEGPYVGDHPDRTESLPSGVGDDTGGVPFS